MNTSFLNLFTWTASSSAPAPAPALAQSMAKAPTSQAYSNMLEDVKASFDVRATALRESFEATQATQLGVFRDELASTRVRVNETLASAQHSIEQTQVKMEDQVAPIAAQVQLGAAHLRSCNAFRRQHPETVLAGVAFAVGLPSLILRGKFFMARDVLVATSATSAALLGARTLDERLVNLSPESLSTQEEEASS